MLNSQRLSRSDLTHHDDSLDNAKNQVDHSFPSPRSLSPALESPKGTMESTLPPTPHTANPQPSDNTKNGSDELNSIMRSLQQFGETVAAGAIVRMQHEEAVRKLKQKQSERDRWSAHHESFKSLAEEQEKDLEKSRAIVTHLKKQKQKSEEQQKMHIMQLATVMLTMGDGGALQQTEAKAKATVKQHEVDLKQLDNRVSDVERKLSLDKQAFESISSAQNSLKEKVHAVDSQSASIAEHQQLRTLVAAVKIEADKVEGVKAQVAEFGLKVMEMHKELQSLRHIGLDAGNLKDNVGRLENGFNKLGADVKFLKAEILGTGEHNPGLMTILEKQENQIGEFRDVTKQLSTDINMILESTDELGNRLTAIEYTYPTLTIPPKLGAKTEERIEKVETAIKAIGERLENEIQINVKKESIIGDDVADIRAEIKSLQDKVTISNPKSVSELSRESQMRLGDQATQTMKEQFPYTVNVENEITQLKASNAELAQRVQESTGGVSAEMFSDLANRTVAIVKAEIPNITNLKKDFDQIRQLVQSQSQNFMNLARALQQIEARLKQLPPAEPNQIPLLQHAQNELVALRNAHNAFVLETRSKSAYRDNQVNHFLRVTETKTNEHIAECKTTSDNQSAFLAALRERQQLMENEQMSMFSRINECEDLAIRKLSGISVASLTQPTARNLGNPTTGLTSTIIDLTEYHSDSSTRPSSAMISQRPTNGIPQHLLLKSNSPSHAPSAIKVEPQDLQLKSSSPAITDPNPAPNTPAMRTFHRPQLQPTPSARLNSTMVGVVNQQGSLLQLQQSAAVHKENLKRRKESTGIPEMEETKKRKQSNCENSGPATNTQSNISLPVNPSISGH